MMINPYGGYNFKRKVVVITGGAGGIGRSLALKLSSMGARIVILDSDEVQMSAVVNKIEQGSAVATGLTCDVSDEQQVSQSFATIIAEFGHIDVLVNNAGITHQSTFSDTELSVIERVFAVNYYGAVYCTKYALPSLTEQRGMIITLSSMSGFVPLSNQSAYNASKHALHGFFESLRLELQEQVHIMLVCPGFTATDMRKRALQGDGSTAKEPFTVLGKMSSPGSVADAIYHGAVHYKRLLILSNLGRRARWLALVLPTLYERLLLRRLNCY